MFNNLPKQNEVMSFQSGNSKRKFFEAMQEEFTRKEATEIDKQFKLSTRLVYETPENSYRSFPH